jgi:hypothetical protein
VADLLNEFSCQGKSATKIFSDFFAFTCNLKRFKVADQRQSARSRGTFFALASSIDHANPLRGLRLKLAATPYGCRRYLTSDLQEGLERL